MCLPAQALLAMSHRTKSIVGEKDRIQFLGLEPEAHTISQWLDAVTDFIGEIGADHDVVMTASRDFAFTLAYIYAGITGYKQQVA